MRTIDEIILHCTATPNGRAVSVQQIDAWHAQRGFSRPREFVLRQNPSLTAIGYHFVIYVNGGTATGRHMDEIGAHAHGHNVRSMGVVLVGTDRFSVRQWCALRETVEKLQGRYPLARTVGHRDLPGVHKTCPGFDVEDWLDGGMAPLDRHVFDGTAPGDEGC